jgi:hypothetical protein
VRERERCKQTTSGRSSQCTYNSDPITSTSELLLRQNSVTAHAQQSEARQLASDHCPTEIHRPRSAEIRRDIVNFFARWTTGVQKLPFTTISSTQPCVPDAQKAQSFTSPLHLHCVLLRNRNTLPSVFTNRSASLVCVYVVCIDEQRAALLLIKQIS